MHQRLCRRFEHEKHKLQAKTGSALQAFNPDLSICVFSPTVLCTQSGLDNWITTLPFVDETSLLLDMWLLQELSKIVVFKVDDIQPALSRLSDHVKFTLDYSLKVSSRPPTDFSAHQKISWTLDAWASAEAEKPKFPSIVLESHCKTEKPKFPSIVLEFWFKWHTSLWTHCRTHLKNVIGGAHGYDVMLPDVLFQPVKMAAVDNILQSTSAIRDHFVHMLKLRVSSHYLLRRPSLMVNAYDFLVSTARCLFQQVIFAHKKSFEADKYSAITSWFCFDHKGIFAKEKIHEMILSLSSSNHRAFTALIDSQIVFRLDPEKFIKLKYECDEFISFVTTSLSLTRTVKTMNIEELAVQVQNCQVPQETSEYYELMQPLPR